LLHSGASTQRLLGVVSDWRSICAGALLVGAVASAAFLLWPKPAPPLLVLTPTPRPTASPAPLVVVHLTGAVVSPGVYRLASGARVDEAVAAAGGFTDEADPGSVNLAARLVDGQQITIRTRGAAGSAPASPEPMGLDKGDRSGRLNINAASLADLDALPGIGQALAQRIVERRQRLGPFQSVEQLREERLIPSATFERIKDLVSVS
jgi:competence protein ComEA